MATAGRMTLVKAVVTAVAIYRLTMLDLSVEVLRKIDRLRHAYLWAGSDKVTGGWCKINWDHVCKPKEFVGLGTVNLEKFATALHLRWLWMEWDTLPPPTQSLVWLGDVMQQGRPESLRDGY